MPTWKTRGLRGSAFESLINSTNEYYRKNELALVQKIPTPITPLKFDGERKLITEAYFEKDSTVDYIGVSCNKELSSTEWVEWFKTVFRIIRSSRNPNVKTHAFGMTSLRILEQFPFTSADSTSWVRSASFGNLIVGYYSVYVSNRNLHDPGHINNQSPAVKQAVANICAKYNFNLDEIINDDKPYPRALFNLCSLNEWAQNYQYKGTDEFLEDLW